MDRIEAGLYQKFSKIGSVEAFINAVALTNVNGDPTLALTSMVSRIGALSVATLADHIALPNHGLNSGLSHNRVGMTVPIVNSVEENFGESLEPVREFADHYGSALEIPGFAALGAVFGKYASHAILTLSSLKEKGKKSEIEIDLVQIRNERKSYNYALIGTIVGGLIGIIRNLDL